MPNPLLFTHTIGWDVGGAHLKSALLNSDGAILQVMQVPCPLWRGLETLKSAVDHVLAAFHVASASTRHVITMTGELADLFQSREQGVMAIGELMASQLKPSPSILFFAGVVHQEAVRFIPLSEVGQHWQSIASANWLASAHLLGRLLKGQGVPSTNALLLDIGSTTADFVLLRGGVPACIGYTDAARMQSEELVYTGVVRTPLMAIAHKIGFRGLQTSVAAEYFATTADVYRLTGDLNPANDMADTADGADKSQQCSARRLARMIGHDLEDAPMADWLVLAQAFKSVQMQRLKEAVASHLSRLGNTEAASVLILGAGAGAFLAEQLAQDLGLSYNNITQYIPQHLQADDHQAETSRLACVCLPAYATAYLAFNQFMHEQS